MSAITESINRKKPFVFGLVVGLLVGPLVSGLMGWQVSSAFLTRSVRNAVVTQQVDFCKMRVLANVKNPEKLDYTARYAVAEQWAKLPGTTAADSDVVSACTDQLGG